MQKKGYKRTRQMTGKTRRILPLKEEDEAGRRKVSGICKFFPQTENLYLLLILWDVKASPGGNTSKVNLYWLRVCFIISRTHLELEEFL